MPPKSALTGSFLASTDAENEVVCPLLNQDGSNCRKRCIGEKRYRSMQEHIRRAHPDHYIPKLPATEESFQLMINTPPSERPPLPPSTITAPARRSDAGITEPQLVDTTLTEPSGFHERQGPATANAVVALTQMHNWDSDYEDFTETELKHEQALGRLSPHDSFQNDTPPSFQSSRKELLPSILTSPTGRYASLPPLYRRDKGPRPRKESVGQYARKGKHERGKSKDFSKDFATIKEFSRRFSTDGRKAMSAEPPAAAWIQGKRWEDLIEAATSATEADDDRDLTPMPQSPNFPPASSTIGGAPAASQSGGGDGGISGGAYERSSLPPGFRPPGHLHPHQHQYNASPLQRTLTPPPPDAIGPNDPEPFPSIESGGSGQNFHISRSGLPTSASSNENTSPLQYYSHPYQHSQSSSFGSRAELLEILCASCGRPWQLKNAFACTECICGVCSDCVGQIISSPVITIQPGIAPSRRGCPRCGVMGGKWKRFQLDFR